MSEDTTPKLAVQELRRSGPTGAHLKKHKDFVVMRPPAGKSISVTARKIYTSILATAQGHLGRMNQPMLATDKFQAPMSAILTQIGLGDMKMQYAKELVVEMATWVLIHETANDSGETELFRVQNMLVSPELNLEGNTLWLRWSLDADIIRLLDPQTLKDPSNHYAYINLLIASKLSSYAAFALYEICAKFKDNFDGLTASKPRDWWIDALSSKAPAEGEKRRPWVKFKSEKVLPALDEINTGTDLTVVMLEDKKDGTVGFRVTKKDVAPQVLLQPTRIDYGLIQQAMAVGISEARITVLIQEFSESLVRECLQRLEDQISARGPSSIKNSFAWLRRVLENEKEVLATAAAATSRQELLEAPIPSTAKPKEVSGESEESLMLTRAKDDFNLLSTEARKEWFERAIKDLASQGFKASPREVLRAATDWRLGGAGGMLSGKVISLFANEIFGKGWRENLGPRRIS